MSEATRIRAPYHGGYRSGQRVKVVKGQFRGLTLSVVGNVGLRCRDGETIENVVRAADGEWQYDIAESELRPLYPSPTTAGPQEPTP